MDLLKQIHHTASRQNIVHVNINLLQISITTKSQSFTMWWNIILRKFTMSSINHFNSCLYVMHNVPPHATIIFFLIIHFHTIHNKHLVWNVPRYRMTCSNPTLSTRWLQILALNSWTFTLFSKNLTGVFKNYWTNTKFVVLIWMHLYAKCKYDDENWNCNNFWMNAKISTMSTAISIYGWRGLSVLNTLIFLWADTSVT